MTLELTKYLIRELDIHYKLAAERLNWENPKISIDLNKEKQCVEPS